MTTLLPFVLAALAKCGWNITKGAGDCGQTRPLGVMLGVRAQVDERCVAWLTPSAHPPEQGAQPLIHCVFHNVTTVRGGKDPRMLSRGRGPLDQVPDPVLIFRASSTNSDWFLIRLGGSHKT